MSFVSRVFKYVRVWICHSVLIYPSAVTPHPSLRPDSRCWKMFPSASSSLSPQNSLATKTKIFLVCLSALCSLLEVSSQSCCITPHSSIYPVLKNPLWSPDSEIFRFWAIPLFYLLKNPSSIAPPPVSLLLTSPRCFSLSRVLRGVTAYLSHSLHSWLYARVYVCARAEAAAEARHSPPSLCCHARAGNIRLAQETHSLNSNAPPASQIYKASTPP